MHTAKWVSSEIECVGAEREVGLYGLGNYVERFLAWEPGQRFAFTMTESSSPLANAIAEDFKMSPVRDGAATRIEPAASTRDGSAGVGDPLVALPSATAARKSVIWLLPFTSTRAKTSSGAFEGRSRPFLPSRTISRAPDASSATTGLFSDTWRARRPLRGNRRGIRAGWIMPGVSGRAPPHLSLFGAQRTRRNPWLHARFPTGLGAAREPRRAFPRGSRPIQYGGTSREDQPDAMPVKPTQQMADRAMAGEKIGVGPFDVTPPNRHVPSE